MENMKFLMVSMFIISFSALFILITISFITQNSIEIEVIVAGFGMIVGSFFGIKLFGSSNISNKKGIIYYWLMGGGLLVSLTASLYYL